ncbi:glutathione S-transferase family protein [Trichocoleus desertorum GB2-A4]|uniref:Glutathione S-transferase family protein n=2 Tax=Trichocoleusaceae TaxID=2303527 RepID=A0ABV0J8K5_9CYAN|nr:glutathione S-transferase family protein [Trichocoleus sp. FACHB-46]MBD1861116.1 glutathione S-transferase family protein [Trichocoleus sp. FACHB-46]
MLELYQFEMSHYCEKVRLILDYKGLAYRKIEVTPGIGQLDLYRMSGQRQVPVLKDGNEVIADSTAIGKYLDRQYPDRPVIPTDPKQKGLCFMLEDWADEVLGLNARKAMLAAFSQSPDFRTAALPTSTPALLKNLIGSVPSEVLDVLSFGVGMGPDALHSAKASLRQNLEALTFILLDHPYLISDQPTLADFAVAGLSMYIKFPSGPYLDIPEGLKGKGVPGVADIGTFEPFFNWRDRLYTEYRKSFTPATSPSSSTRPTSIDIE